jgi:hypothetical protein
MIIDTRKWIAGRTPRSTCSLITNPTTGIIVRLRRRPSNSNLPLVSRGSSSDEFHTQAEPRQVMRGRVKNSVEADLGFPGMKVCQGLGK